MIRLASIWSMFRGFHQAQAAGQRAFRGGRKAASSTLRNRPRLEALEDRLTPAIRFVVPADVPADNLSTFHTLASALDVAGIVSGDAVEIKQGSFPGGIINTDLPEVKDFTIRGEAGVGPDELAPITLLDAATIAINRSDFTFQNLNLDIAGGTLTFQANASLESNHIVVNSASSTGIVLGNNAQHVRVENNQIFGTSQNVLPTLIFVDPPRLSHNIIAGNLIAVTNDETAIDYGPGGATADIIRDNTIVQLGGTITTMLIISSGIDGLTIQHNLFGGAGSAGSGIFALAGIQHLSIFQNTFDFPSDGVGEHALEFVGGTDGLDTSVSIIGNTIQAGTGTGINFALAATGSFHALVQANDFLGAGIGVSIEPNGFSLANIDLGGGTEGSEGANNFRFARTPATSDAAAIAVGSGSGSTGSVQAQDNLFSHLGAEAEVFDKNDDSTLADVVTTGSVTGNTAYVQALFGRFLHRAADLTSANDGSGLVTQLNNGVSAAIVVNAISRSPEAFGFVVDGLYHSILGRDPDSAGQTAFINQLVGGTTLENVKATFFSSPEYLNRFASDRAFVVSLYATVLNRLGSDAEYQIWVSQNASAGRSAVAVAILNSSEAHGQAAANLYLTLLKRAANATEIIFWTSAGLDELSIQTDIAASPEALGNL